jgi:hypothetical protein
LLMLGAPAAKFLPLLESWYKRHENRREQGHHLKVEPGVGRGVHTRRMAIAILLLDRLAPTCAKRWLAWLS